MDRRSWVEAACRPEFWIEREPALAIGGPPAAPLFTVEEPMRFALLDALLTDGYFQLPPRLPDEQVARMAAAVSRLVEARIPVGFAYVYDDFWALSAQIGELLAAVLGPGFRMLPDLWAWCVDPKHADRGWHPHRDKAASESILPNGLPSSLSIWVPLTDATPDNGCIYVVPASRDPHYLARTDEATVEDVQDVRALPARAGSILGWNQNLLHWGGRASPRAAGPRISMSIEYQRADRPPLNEPLLDPSTPPPFARRMALIGKQILQYTHMHGLDEEFEAVAERLIERFPL